MDFKHFWNIVTLPDNIPIAMMVVFIAFCLSYAVHEMRENDRLIKSGRKQDVYDRMIR